MPSSGVQGNMDLLFPFIVILNDIRNARGCTCTPLFWVQMGSMCESARAQVNSTDIPSHIVVRLSKCHCHRACDSDRQKSVSRHEIGGLGLARRDTTYLHTTELYNAQQEREQLNDSRQHTTVILVPQWVSSFVPFVVLLVSIIFLERLQIKLLPHSRNGEHCRFMHGKTFVYTFLSNQMI